jgi:hypothetical protein
MKAARGRWLLAMRSASVLLLSMVNGCGGGNDDVYDSGLPAGRVG